MKGFEGTPQNTDDEILTRKVKKDLKEAGLTLTPKKSEIPEKIKGSELPAKKERSKNPTPEEIAEIIERLKQTNTEISRRKKQPSEDRPKEPKKVGPAETESPQAEPENEEKMGIYRTINHFFYNHPKLRYLRNTVTALLLTYDIDFFTNLSGLHMRMPEIQYRVEKREPNNKKLEAKLASEVGEREVLIIERESSAESPEERAELVELPNEIKTDNFEGSILSREELTSILNETLPKGFRRNINTVRYKKIKGKLDMSYYIPKETVGNESSDNTAAGDANRYKGEINIYNSTPERDSELPLIDRKLYLVNHTLMHEIFHLEDWVSNDLLTVDEKIELYEKIIGRLKSPDRFKSEYVESFISNPDSKKELSMKANEYFAEIGAAYISPDRFLLPSADAQIIADLIKKTDPNFQRGRAVMLRDRILGIDTSRFGKGSDEESTNLEIQENKKFWDENMRLWFQGKYPDKTEIEINSERDTWAESAARGTISRIRLRYKD